MATTPVYDFPYPISTDPVGLGYQNFEDLAYAVEGRFSDPRYSQRRNLLDNALFRVAQRGTSITGITSTRYTLDRWRFETSSNGTWQVLQQTATSPHDGWYEYVRLRPATADASPAAGDYSFFAQRISAAELQSLRFGQGAAMPLSLSFWHRTNRAGMYVVQLVNAAGNRSVNRSFTSTGSGSWERVTMSVDGDTATLLDPAAASPYLEIRFWLSAGTTYTSGAWQSVWGTFSNATSAVGDGGTQVNAASSTANYVELAKVQLEAGPQSTPFDYLPVAVEYDECLRYYRRWTSTAAATAFGLAGVMFTTTNLSIPLRLPRPMRATPVPATSGTFDAITTATLTVSAVTVTMADAEAGLVQATTSAGTAGHAGYLRMSSGAWIELAADL